MFQLLLGVLLAPAPPEHLSGVVRNAGGSPVAGAQVYMLTEFGRSPVFRKAESDARGAFAFGDLTAIDSEWRTWVLVGHRPDLALGVVMLHSVANLSDPIPLVLKKPKKLRLELIDPEQRPLEEASVVLEYINDGGTAFLGALDVSLPLDDAGGVTLDLIASDAQCSLRIRTKQYGEQHAYPTPSEEKQICQLGAVGSLTGRVIADDPEAVKGLALELRSYPTGTAQRAKISGMTELRTDDEGRFEVPALLAGRVSGNLKVNEKLPYRLAGQVQSNIEAGKTADLEIRLVRGVRVEGTVLERDSSKPVAGVTVHMQGTTTKTGPDGRYEAIVAPGEVHLNIGQVPAPYIAPLEAMRTEVVAPGEEPRSLKPFMLERGVPLEGTVVDGEGKPAGGARVVALWQKREGNLSTLGSDAAVADADGRFVLQAVSGSATLALTAATSTQTSPGVIEVQPGATERLRLVLTEDALTTVAGRVVGSDGRPVAGAQVTFMVATRIPGGQIYGSSLVAFDGSRALKTDANGDFRTPRRLARRERYTLTVEAEGMLKHQTSYLELAAKGEARLPDIQLTRMLGVRGRVVDSEGQPVRGAKVFAHGMGTRNPEVETQTDDGGQFRLEEIHPNAAFVFASKAGFRLHGMPIPRSNQPIDIAIAPADRSSGKRISTLSRPATDQAELLRRLILPIVPRLWEGTSSYFVSEAIKRLAPHDTDFVRAQLEKLTSGESRARALIALGDVDAALEQAELIEEPYGRTFLFLDAARAAEDAERKDEILAQALVHARTIPKPDQRVVMLGMIAERLFDAGRRDAATRIIEEGLPVARELAPVEWSGFARGNFAETVALVDSDAAGELVKDLKPENVFNRHTGNIAHELASIHPEEAERCLARIQQDNSVTPYAVRVCYRMAPVDRERAERIASRVASIEQKAYAYGVMAYALRDQDSETARRFLEQAFDQLAGGHRDSYGRLQAFGVAASLVHFSEAIAPDRTEEYLWRALAMHPGPGGEGYSPERQQKEQDEQVATLVLVAAAYGVYPEVTRELMRPIFERAKGYTSRQDFYRSSGIFIAMALADPEQTLAWHADFQPQVSKEDLRLIPQPWMTVADVFGGSPESLWELIEKEVFHLWVIDTEDF